jgi:hypothetical protein
MIGILSAWALLAATIATIGWHLVRRSPAPVKHLSDGPAFARDWVSLAQAQQVDIDRTAPVQSQRVG